MRLYVDTCVFGGYFDIVFMEGGILHYYEFAKTPNPLETAKVRLVEAVKEAGRDVDKVLFAKTVRATAPFEWQIVMDAKIQ